MASKQHTAVAAAEEERLFKQPLFSSVFLYSLQTHLHLSQPYLSLVPHFTCLCKTSPARLVLRSIMPWVDSHCSPGSFMYASNKRGERGRHEGRTTRKPERTPPRMPNQSLLLFNQIIQGLMGFHERIKASSLFAFD